MIHTPKHKIRLEKRVRNKRDLYVNFACFVFCLSAHTIHIIHILLLQTFLFVTSSHNKLIRFKIHRGNQDD